MKIAFFNHNENADIEKVGSAIKTAVEEQFFIKLEATTGVETLVEDKDIQVCVFHQTPNNWDLDDLKSSKRLDRSRPMIVCLISSAPMRPEILAIQGKSAIHYRFTIPNLKAAGLLGSNDGAMQNKWKEFIEALKADPFTLQEDGTISVSEKISWYLNPDQSALLAFRLLCAAKKVCGEANEKENALGTALTIYAPENLTKWLEPFGFKNGEVEKAAKIIGAGRLNSEVKAVFDSVENGCDDLFKAITDFESAFKVQQSKAES